MSEAQDRKEDLLRRLGSARPERRRLLLALRAVAAAAVAATATSGAILLARAWRPPPSPAALPDVPRPAASARATPPVSAPPQAACPKVVVANGSEPLIDDFEDRNARILPVEGRDGTWAAYNDGTSKQTPSNQSPLHPSHLPKNRGASAYALHASGDQLTQWGAIVMASLVDRDTCYDASAYDGIEFWANGNTRVSVRLSVIDAMPVASGGLCKSDCYGEPGVPVNLGKDWAKYTITWERLKELGAKGQSPFDPGRITSLQFSIDAADTPFDIWIDDVRFVPRP
jgi:hypothetical protein